jgi:hypothetical protein
LSAVAHFHERRERTICLSSQYPGPVPLSRKLERAAPRSPIWPCTRWGFPCLEAYAWSGGLLLHLFTLTPTAQKHGRGSLFSVALSVGTPRGIASRVYPEIAAEAAFQVTRHRALWCSDFPPPGEPGSDSPPFQNRDYYTLKTEGINAPEEPEKALELSWLLRHREVHVAGVIQNPPAVAARDQFLLRLALNEQLRGNAHVATAANAVLHAHNHVFAFALCQSFVAGPSARIYSPGEFSCLRFCSRAFRFESCSSMSFRASLVAWVARSTSRWVASACSINSISRSSILNIS